MSDKYFLAMETSCDETAVAIVQHSQDTISVLSQAVASQIDIHAVTGGVVPEVAAREHVAVLPSLIKTVLEQSQLAPAELNAIAVTVGPGLMPALVIGVTAAQTLAYAWKKPIIPIHHLEGHLYSALIGQENPKAKLQNLNKPPSNIPQTFTIPNPKTTFPALALIVSGGHTILIQLNDHLQYNILGTTRDDAAGEAFDKVARLLNMPYPGGSAISQAAVSGNPKAYPFTRPMLRSGDLDFSFSGLKTEVLYKVRELSKDQPVASFVNDIAASFQAAVVDSLLAKTSAAIKQTKPRLLLLAGGVAANTNLRRAFTDLAAQTGIPLRIAPLPLCSDNAVMIGLPAVFAYQAGRLSDWRDIDAVARPDLSNFSASASTA